MNCTPPLLIFGYGNISRGDDGLGPLALEFLQNHSDPGSVEIQTDFQLQIEHALDLVDRRLVLFIDASVAGIKAFDFGQLTPACDNSYTTHAMSPAAVLQVYQDIRHAIPPPCFLLSIKGEHFELGADLSPQAESNLHQANKFAEQLLLNPTLAFWQQQAESRFRIPACDSFKHNLSSS